jgi:hypothetical protein
MLRKLIASFPSAEWTCAQGSRSSWVYSPLRLLRRAVSESEQGLDALPERQHFLAHSCVAERKELEEKKENENAAFHDGHSLFQELFFFCTVKNVGDVPGTGCIYVETVVDRDSRIAFAKVYPSKNAMNAVDILTSRVMPFFERQGIAIKEIHTRKTSGYSGLPSIHPYETFLATARVQHLPKDQPGHPNNYQCEQFYRLLLKEFFLPELRRKFQLSLDGLQKDLDAFVEAYNARRMKHENAVQSGPHPSSNFPVDL